MSQHVNNRSASGSGGAFDYDTFYKKIIIVDSVLCGDSSFADTGRLTLRLTQPLPNVKSVALLGASLPAVDNNRYACIGLSVNDNVRVSVAMLPSTSREPTQFNSEPLFAVVPLMQLSSASRNDDSAMVKLAGGLYTITDNLDVPYNEWVDLGGDQYSAWFSRAITSLNRLDVNIFESPMYYGSSGALRPFQTRVFQVRLLAGGPGASNFLSDGSTVGYATCTVRYLPYYWLDTTLGNNFYNAYFFERNDVEDVGWTQVMPAVVTETNTDAADFQTVTDSVSTFASESCGIEVYTTFADVPSAPSDSETHAVVLSVGDGSVRVLQPTLVLGDGGTRSRLVWREYGGPSEAVCKDAGCRVQHSTPEEPFTGYDPAWWYDLSRFRWLYWHVQNGVWTDDETTGGPGTVVISPSLSPPNAPTYGNAIEYWIAPDVNRWYRADHGIQEWVEIPIELPKVKLSTRPPSELGTDPYAPVGGLHSYTANIVDGKTPNLLLINPESSLEDSPPPKYSTIIGDKTSLANLIDASSDFRTHVLLTLRVIGERRGGGVDDLY